MAGLPPQWNKWVLQNLLKGVPASTLYTTLLENGFTFQAVSRALGTNLPAKLQHPHNADFYKALSQPGLLSLPQLQSMVDSQVSAQLYCLPGFLSEQECERLVALTKSKLRPSEITRPEGYDGFRTSSTCDLPHLNDPLCDHIDNKIKTTLDLSIDNDETIQAQHYGIGQQFKAHTDYFEPGSDEYKKFAGEWGQRTWTFMVYLNDGCQGGETEFLKLGVKIHPQTGTAVIWNNLLENGNVNPLTLHQSHPVTAGEKVVITKWFRTGKPSTTF